ncbi:MAG: hypothetical protein IKI37_08125, partial [Oscillospiraceae bacterium]|nr:hypothetical protein [Oscillospiraceae bacterium]
LKDFAENLIEAKRVPKSVAVIDDRTEALLSHFCQACDIKLTRVERFKKLHVAEEELNSEEFLNTAMDFMGLLDFIDKIPEEQLATFPPEIQKEFITLMKSHMLPEELEEKLKKVWKL